MDINRAKAMEKLSLPRGGLVAESAPRALAQDVALDVSRADLNLAHLAYRRGRYRQAIELYGRARDGFADLENEMEVAATGFYRSKVYLALNLFSRGTRLATQAHRIFKDRGMARYAIQATAIQASAARGLGNVQGALALFDQACSGLRERGEEIQVAFLDLQRAATLRQTGRPSNCSGNRRLGCRDSWNPENLSLGWLKRT